MMWHVRKIVLILILTSSVLSLMAQQEKTKVSGKENQHRNRFFFSIGMKEHYSNLPVYIGFLSGKSNYQTKNALDRRLGYERQLSEKIELEIAFSKYSYNYNESREVHFFQVGETVQIWEENYSLTGIYYFLVYPKWKLGGRLGAIYRKGGEYVHLGYGWFDSRLTHHSFTGWGGAIGVRGSYALPWRFELFGEAEYARFFPKDYTKGIQHFPNRRPNNKTLTGRLGIGWRF